jgi:hypothetical protein
VVFHEEGVINCVEYGLHPPVVVYIITLPILCVTSSIVPNHLPFFYFF